MPSIYTISLPGKPASFRHQAVLTQLAQSSAKHCRVIALSIVDKGTERHSIPFALLAEKAAPVKPALDANALSLDKSHLNPADGQSTSKLERKRDNVTRVTVELEAALALHQAGIDCRVKKSVVCAVKGWSRATLYRRVADGSFPKPIKRDRYSEWRIADVITIP